MAPTKFQPKLNGPWLPWANGSVDNTQLREKAKAANGQPVFINGCELFALRFENKTEWNVKDGWK